MITAVAGLMGGHAYDRNTNLDESELMHRSTLKYNAEERSSLDFRLKLIEWKYRELHREVHGRRRASSPDEGVGDGMGSGAGMSGGGEGPPIMPGSRLPTEAPRSRGRVDHYDKLMQHVGEGRVYQPKGYGH